MVAPNNNNIEPRNQPEEEEPLDLELLRLNTIDMSTAPDIQELLQQAQYEHPLQGMSLFQRQLQARLALRRNGLGDRHWNAEVYNAVRPAVTVLQRDLGLNIDEAWELFTETFDLLN